MKLPKLRRHSSGQGHVRITINKKREDFYFGVYGTPECKAAYEQWIARWLLNGRQVTAAPAAITINHIAAAYLLWCKTHYVKNGQPSGGANRIKYGLRLLCAEFGDLPAEQFNIACFERVQERMVEAGWTLGYCNACCGALRAMFVWAGAREYITAERAMRIKMASGLRKGQSAAVPSEKVKPVAEDVVMGTVAHLGRIPAAMVQVQWYTGMRPGEVCLLRACDIDRSTTPWCYRPHRHKTEHHDAERIVFLGPRVRELLAPFIARAVFAQDHQGYLFSAREAKEEQIEVSGRKIKNGCARPGDHYSVHGYSQAVERAARRAGLPHWTPLQIRHSRLTATRSEFGPDAARAQASHRSLSSTEVYAELDMEKARNVAERTG